MRRLEGRMIYKRLVTAMNSLCVNMSYRLLWRISPHLAYSASEATTKFAIRFRLTGFDWPPKILYQAKVINLKSIAFAGSAS